MRRASANTIVRGTEQEPEADSRVASISARTACNCKHRGEVYACKVWYPQSRPRRSQLQILQNAEGGPQQSITGGGRIDEGEQGFG